MVSIKCNNRRKARRAHFQAPSHVRRILMSARLAKEMRDKYNVRALPVRKDDEVRVVRGVHKGKTGKVTACYRLKWVIHIDKVTRERANGTAVPVGVHPSNVEITKPKLPKMRKAIIDRKDNARKGVSGKKTSITNAEKAMQQMD